MASKKKKVLGALGPQPHWLRMSPTERARTKQYIKEGLLGYERSDHIAIPGARRVYKGLSAAEGYDLRHIERWSAAKLASARKRIQSVATLTSRPFVVASPRTAKQRKSAQIQTGQTSPNQKIMFVQIQDDKRDKAVFRDNRLAIERQFPSGAKTIQQRWLFRDFLDRGEAEPITFAEMREITQRMLPDMPAQIYGRDAFYTIFTAQYGPIGRSVVKSRVLELLAEYHARYDPGGMLSRGHERFAEHVIGFQMVGTFAQASAREIEQQRRSQAAKQRRQLRFRAPINRCAATSKGRRCVLVAGHSGKHKFRRR